ncbi:MAG TPA: TetR/AcrR family transcriptional regulator [Streptosporangiaceae bacterium]|nr:TetR/AcrR family transcriptional regulator [Streptosporangiaceae bacterium]
MPARGKDGRYHHGDLRAALIETAIEVIGERGVRGFSMAEASRRLGVAVSAPYAHFADRDELLAAVAVHAYQLFYAELSPAVGQVTGPAGQLAELARCYVRFAAAHRPLFEVLYEAGLDKARHPEIETAAEPIDDLLSACVRALSDDQAGAGELASALEATANGHVVLFFDNCAGQDEQTVAQAAERAARSTLALIESRHLLTRPHDQLRL